MDQDYYGNEATMPTWAIILICAVVLLQFIGMWRVFEKAGKPGWAAIIPIYNYVVLCQVGGKPGWWVILCIFIPFFIIWPLNMVSKSFGHDEGYTVGLFLLPFIFWPMLGFGKDKYQGPFGNPEAYRAYQEQHKFEFENK